ncbi:MAG: sodium:proton antiporter [Acetobacteraceae bacterium]|nr:sodium:proton antiporter [Acetobacteraceae bacterium]
MQPTEAACAAGCVPGLIWAAPFLGILLSIAVLPAVAPRFWHRRMAWVSAFWIAALLVPLAVAAGPGQAAATAWRAILIQYLPFVTLLLALYAAGGGMLIRGGPVGTPAGNTAMLAAGMGLGIVMGQAGAAMVMINPLLHANAHRRRKVHLALFLIVLIANASGALTPLGNPPLYIGFLQGVPFFWTTRHLWRPLLVFSFLLLGAFYGLDKWLARDDPPRPNAEKLRVRGWGNAVLILVTGAAVLVQGVVDAGTVTLAGQPVSVMRLAAVGVFVGVTWLSAAATPRAVRQANDFSWAPMIEVAELFLAIFVTIAPVLTMLRAGLNGPLAPVLRLTLDAAGHPRPLAYFWLAGMLSAFLDNAPTYLVFFNLTGIHAPAIAPEQVRALEELSAGAVFFGGLTYIGNAPNLMVRGVAAHRGVRMPGFFSYMTLSAALLLPVFALLTALFFH